MADDSIISDPLSGSGSQRWKVDLVRDPVVTLNSYGDQELIVDVTGVSADITEALMVSGIQNININDGSSSNITTDDDSSMRIIE